MKYAEIIKLLDAGYTRDEILAMQEGPAEPEPVPADPDPAETDPAPADIAGEVMKEVKDMFAEMKKELTALNIMNSRQDGDTIKTGEGILANIINPTRVKNGGND